MDRKSNRNEDGTSAIIGVILIVVITVILSAVIAEFSFQMGSQLPAQHIIGVKVARINSGVVMVTTMGGLTDLLTTGGSDHSDATQATYTCTYSTTGLPLLPCKVDGSPATNYDASAVGNNMYFPVNPGEDITVIAHFNDDTTAFAFSGKIL
jgi:hypothetical protein